MSTQLGRLFYIKILSLFPLLFLGSIILMPRVSVVGFMFSGCGFSGIVGLGIGCSSVVIWSADGVVVLSEMLGLGGACSDELGVTRGACSDELGDHTGSPVLVCFFLFLRYSPMVRLSKFARMNR